jgi:carboxylate-amine ligase
VLLLDDPRTGRPVPLATGMLAAASSDGTLDVSVVERRPGATPLLQPELQQQQCEVASTPQRELRELVGELRVLRRLADAAAQDFGGRAVALPTSPLPSRPRLTAGARYRRMRSRFGLTCAEALACGCHVHVGVSSDEEGVAVIDRIRSWLPVLTAIAASSPFWEGRDTGYASYRTQLQGRWPSNGPTDVFGSAAAYHRVVEQMMTTGSLLDEGMVYFDARLSRRYPTVEVRVADVNADVEMAGLVAALTRALVETAAQGWRAGEPVDSTPTTLLRLATWRASRCGIAGGDDADLVHPVTGDLRPAQEVVEALLHHVTPALWAAGDLEVAEDLLQEALRRAGGAGVQRDVARRAGLPGVVADAVERTVA